MSLTIYILELLIIVLLCVNIMIAYEIYNQLTKQVIPSESKSLKTKAPRKSIAKAVRRLLLEQAGSKCATCGRECCSPHIDHIKPVALGGGDEIENLQVLCASCNLHKGAKHETKLHNI